MHPKESQRLNRAAFRKLKPMIDQKYPPGRFVALHGGQIIADAPSFRELHAMVLARGLVDPDEVLALQAGVNYPEYADILVECVMSSS